jgi:hypothetical protein
VLVLRVGEIVAILALALAGRGGAWCSAPHPRSAGDSGSPRTDAAGLGSGGAGCSNAATFGSTSRVLAGHMVVTLKGNGKKGQERAQAGWMREAGTAARRAGRRAGGRGQSAWRTRIRPVEREGAARPPDLGQGVGPAMREAGISAGRGQLNDSGGVAPACLFVGWGPRRRVGKLTCNPRGNRTGRR